MNVEPRQTIIKRHGGKGSGWFSPPLGDHAGEKEEVENKFKDILDRTEKEIVKNPYETAVAFDSNGNEILRKVGGQSNVVFTEKEMINLLETDKITFTHNHPKDVAFSPHDIYFMRKCRIDEMRAVGEKYLYRAKLKEDINYYQINRIVEKKNIEVRGWFRDMIGEGRMSINEANSKHWHVVWDEIQKENDWLFYERTIR